MFVRVVRWAASLIWQHLQMYTNCMHTARVLLGVRYGLQQTGPVTCDIDVILTEHQQPHRNHISVPLISLSQLQQCQPVSEHFHFS